MKNFLKKNKNAVITLAIALLLFILMSIFLKEFLSGIRILAKTNVPLTQFLKFPVSIATMSWLASDFYPLIILAFLFLVQNFSRGKPEIFCKSAVKTAAILSLLWTILAVLLGIITGLIHGESHIHSQLWQPLLLWVQLFSLSIFALIFITIWEKPGIAIIYILIYFLTEAIIRKIIFVFNSPVAHYFPIKVITRMVVPPSIDFLNKYDLNEYLSFNPLPAWLSVILAFAYDILFCIISLKILKSKKHEQNKN
jgi:hypothetical protein